MDSLHRINDTGSSSADLVTSDPQVGGVVNGNGYGNYVQIDFDHAADGSIDASTSAYSPGEQFAYDPRWYDYALAGYAGPFTLRYRATEYDYSYNVLSQSDWQSFAFTVEPPPAPEITVSESAPSNGDPIDLTAGMSNVWFGSTIVGTPLRRTFAVRNTGTDTLTLDVNSFSVPWGFALETPPAGSVEAGGATSFTVRLDGPSPGYSSYPGSSYPYTGQISFGTNDGDENPFVFYVGGEVAEPAPEVSVVYAGAAGGAEVASGGYVDLGNFVLGTPPSYSFIVQNTGDGVLTLGALSLPSGFSLESPLAAVVPSGGSTTFTVVANDPANGYAFYGDSSYPYGGQLSLATNDPDESWYYFTVSGVVSVPQPEISVSYSPAAGYEVDVPHGYGDVWLGSTPVGTSVSQTFTLRNTGDDPLTLDAASLTLPAGFSLQTPFADLVAPGGSTRLALWLNAAAPGSYSGSVSFANSDHDENPFEFTVRGEVVGTPIANVAPTLDPIADPAALDEDAGPQTVGLSGITAGGDEWQSVTVTGASSNPQLIADVSVEYMASGTSGTLRFTPAANQSGTAVLTVTVTDDGGTANGGSDSFQRSVVVTVTVVPFNHPPTAAPIPPVTVDEDAADLVLSLWDYLADAEDPDASLVLGDAALASGDDLATALVDPGTGELSLSLLANANGTAHYTVTARDTGGKVATATISLTVNPVNDPPTGPATPLELTLRDASAETVVDLWEYFDDIEDGPDVTFAIVPDSVTNAEVLDGAPAIDAEDYLRLRALAGAGGSAGLTIRATDSAGAATLATVVFATAAPGAVAPATVSIAATQDTSETGADGSFVVQRDGDLETVLDVPYTIAGTATYGIDYTSSWPVSGTLHFPAGEAMVTISLDPATDGEAEGEESIRLRLGGGSGYVLGDLPADSVLLANAAAATGPGTTVAISAPATIGEAVGFPVGAGWSGAGRLRIFGTNLWVGSLEEATAWGTVIHTALQVAPDEWVVDVSGDGTGTFRAAFPDDVPSGSAVDLMTITVLAEGWYGASGSDSRTIAVQNRTPVISEFTGLPAEVDEGSPVEVRVAWYDAYWFSWESIDVPVATIDWGDGTSEVISADSPNATPCNEPWTPEQIAQGTFPVCFVVRHTYLDDDPSGTPQDTKTVTVTVTDDDTGFAAETKAVTVRNVDPGVKIDGFEVVDAVLTDPETAGITYLNPGQLDESEGFIIHGYVTDPGINDTETVTLRMDLNFDGDTIDEGERLSFEVAPNTAFSYEGGIVLDDGATYDVNENRLWGNASAQDNLTVYAEVVDDDTGSGDDSADIQVHNVAPRFSSGPYLEFEYDASGAPLYATVYGMLEDAGVVDEHKLFVRWGDGVLGDGVPPDCAYPASISGGEFKLSRDLVANPMTSEAAVQPVVIEVEDDDLGNAVAMLQAPSPHVKFPGVIVTGRTIPVAPAQVNGLQYTGDGAGFKAAVEAYIKDQLLKDEPNKNGWTFVVGPNFGEVDPAGSVLGYSGIAIASKIVVDARQRGDTLDFRGTKLLIRPYAVVVNNLSTTQATDNWIRISPDGEVPPINRNAQMSIMTHEMWHTEGAAPQWVQGVKASHKIELEPRRGYLYGASLAKAQAEAAFNAYLASFPAGSALPTAADASARAQEIFNTFFVNADARQGILEHGLWHSINTQGNAPYVWRGTRTRVP